MFSRKGFKPLRLRARKSKEKSETRITKNRSSALVLWYLMPRCFFQCRPPSSIESYETKTQFFCELFAETMITHKKPFGRRIKCVSLRRRKKVLNSKSRRSFLRWHIARNNENHRVWVHIAIFEERIGKSK